MLCIKLVNYRDKYTEMHGQQNDKYTEMHGQQNVKKLLIFVFKSLTLFIEMKKLKKTRKCNLNII